MYTGLNELASCTTSTQILHIVHNIFGAHEFHKLQIHGSLEIRSDCAEICPPFFTHYKVNQSQNLVFLWH